MAIFTLHPCDASGVLQVNVAPTSALQHVCNQIGWLA